MPTPLAEGQENSFAPQMIFLWPPARGVGKLSENAFLLGIFFWRFASLFVINLDTSLPFYTLSSCLKMCRKISDMILIVAGPPMEVRETCQRDEDCRLPLLLLLTLLSFSGIIMILPPNQLRVQAGWDLYDLAVRPRHRERQVRLPYHPSTSYFTSLFKKLSLFNISCRRAIWIGLLQYLHESSCVTQHN